MSKFQASLRGHLSDLPKDDNNILPMPDLTGFVTWERLEDALKGIRESLAKSSNDAAAALASAQNTRPPVQLIERQSQTVSRSFSFTFNIKCKFFLFHHSQQNER